MGLDIKLPIGLMFTLLGIIISIYGLATLQNAELYKASLGINVNLWAGLGMLAFGLFFLLLIYLGKKKKRKLPKDA